MPARAQPLHRGERPFELGLELERRRVAEDLGIRRLAEYHDGGIGLFLIVAQRRELGLAAGRPDRVGNASPDRGAAGEIRVGDAGALPADRPAAGLAGDIVGGVARDENVRPRLQGQHAVILEQHEALADRLAGDGAVRG